MKRRPQPSLPAAKVVSVALSIAQINDRADEIVAERSRLNERSSRLSVELEGLNLRRAELMREFDSAAKQ